MRVLVLTTEPITAEHLRNALGSAAEDAEIMVVAPALHKSALRFWLSDADEAIERAWWVRQKSVSRLRDAGLDAAGDTGEGDPVDAVTDALATFPADRVLLFTGADGDRYLGDVGTGELEQRIGLPVEHEILE